MATVGDSNCGTPDGKTGRINMSRKPDGGGATMAIKFSKDAYGNIVIGGDLTYTPPLISLTTAGPAAEGKLAVGDPNSYAKHHLDVVIADADLDKFVDAKWDDFDYGPIQDAAIDNTLAHHHEVAADRLQGGYRLEYRKFDVTYDFHIDKLYELDAAPGAQPMEITL